ncbi:MAG: phosphate--AMP phosphotransferase, partial [Lachnospiraceae bacterium]|nr:phosphate--AMP phosphotransferase [Lachnospiraceae bacterium]
MHRYMKVIPEAGKFAFFDTFWMKEVVTGVRNRSFDEKAYRKRIESINGTERSLHDNGYLIVKFFFEIDKKEQKKRLKALEEDKNAKWRVSASDVDENKNYEEYEKIYDRFLEDTNQPATPWYIIDAKKKKWALLQVLTYLNQAIDIALKNRAVASQILQNPYPLVSMPKLSDVTLDDKCITEEEYEVKLKALQKELGEL